MLCVMLDHSTGYYVLVEIIWLPHKLRPCNLTEMLVSHLYHAIKLTRTVKTSLWTTIFPVVTSFWPCREEATGAEHKMEYGSGF